MLIILEGAACLFCDVIPLLPSLDATGALFRCGVEDEISIRADPRSPHSVVFESGQYTAGLAELQSVAFFII